MAFGKVLKIIYEGDVKSLIKAQQEIAKGQVDMAREISSSSQSVSQNLSSVGSTLTKNVTPIAGTIAVTTAAIGKSWTAMSKEIATQTGATGKELEGLQNSVKNVAGTVKASLPEIGNVISDIATKTDLTGKPLEDLARRILQLKEAGTDLSGVQVAATLGGWGIEGAKMADSMDRILRISQESGVGVGTLMDRLQTFRPILQGMGMDFDTASLFATKLTDAMLPGLRKALAEVAKANSDLSGTQLDAEKAQLLHNEAVKKFGPDSIQARESAEKLAEANRMLALAQKEPGQALKDWIADIKNAKTDQDALAKAVEIFGSKSGPAWAQAVRGGSFELDKLDAAVKENKNTIAETAEEYRTFWDRLEMIRTKAAATIGPVANVAATIATIAGGIGPAIELGAKFVGFLTAKAAAATAAGAGMTTMAVGEAAAGAAAAGAAPGFWAAAAGIWATVAPILAVIAVIALIAGAVYLVVQNWDTIKAATGEAWDWVKEHIDVIVRGILAVLTGGLSEAVLWVVNNWDQIKAKTGEAWDWVKAHIDDAMRIVLAVLTGGLSEAVRWVVTHWDEIKATTGAIWDWVTGKISGAWNTVTSTVSGAVANVRDRITNGFNAVRSGVGSAWDWVRDKISDAINSARDSVRSAVDNIKGYFQGMLDKIQSVVSFINKNMEKLAFWRHSPSAMEVMAAKSVQGVNRSWSDLQNPEMAVASLDYLRNASRAQAIAAGSRATSTSSSSAPLAHIENLNVTVQDPTDLAPGIARELGWSLQGISRGRGKPAGRV